MDEGALSRSVGDGVLGDDTVGSADIFVVDVKVLRLRRISLCSDLASSFYKRACEISEIGPFFLDNFSDQV